MVCSKFLKAPFFSFVYQKFLRAFSFFVKAYSWISQIFWRCAWSVQDSIHHSIDSAHCCLAAYDGSRKSIWILSLTCKTKLRWEWVCEAVMKLYTKSMTVSRWSVLLKSLFIADHCISILVKAIGRLYLIAPVLILFLKKYVLLIGVNSHRSGRTYIWRLLGKCKHFLFFKEDIGKHQNKFGFEA